MTELHGASRDCGQLDRARIEQGLRSNVATRNFERFDVLESVDSTNTFLKDQRAPGAGAFSVAIAEQQTAGRGRHGNHWVSVPGGSLCLSVSRSLRKTPHDLAALTLALGLGAVETLAALGVGDVQLKWPNDLLIGNAKLAGILTETVIRRQDDLTVIIGIGVNVAPLVALAETDVSAWADSATSLSEVMAAPPSREDLAIALCQSFVEVCTAFEADGFAGFAARFAAVDWLTGKRLSVDTPQGIVSGIAQGVAADGALLLDTSSGQQAIHSGSVQQVETLAGAS